MNRRVRRQIIIASIILVAIFAILAFIGQLTT